MDKKFISFLLLLSVLALLAWGIFGLFILPLLPDSELKAGLAMLGYAMIFIVLALVLLERYERENPDDE